MEEELSGENIRLQDNSEKVLARPMGNIWAKVGPLRSPIWVEFACFLLFHHAQYLVRSILGKVSKLKGVINTTLQSTFFFVGALSNIPPWPLKTVRDSIIIL